MGRLARLVAVALALLAPLATSAQETRPAAVSMVRLTGLVFDSTANRALAGAVVQLLPADDRTLVRSVIADSLGRFTFPDVAPGTWMLGFLHQRTDTIPGGSPTHLLTLRAGGVRDVLLYVSASQRGYAALLAQSDPVGRVLGTVQDSAGRPIANARVLQSDEQVLARTSETGAFSLEALPAGGHVLQVRAVGFTPQRFGFAVDPDQTMHLDVQLYPLAPVLATVTATARRTIAGFHARRGRGGGQYLDADDIASRRPQQVAEALRLMQGVVITRRRSFSSQILVRSEFQVCEPAVYLDGVELLTQTRDLDAFVDVDDIAAMEVYIKRAEMPLEFPGIPFCGAILIWRKEDPRVDGRADPDPLQFPLI